MIKVQFHHLFFLLFHLQVTSRNFLATSFHIAEKYVQRKLNGQGDAVRQRLPCQLAISVWILLNLWMALQDLFTLIY